MTTLMLLKSLALPTANGRKQSFDILTPQSINSLLLQARAIYLLGSSSDICYTPTTH